MSAHSVCLYGLSTCIHCRHACDFLESRGIPFVRVHVDTLTGDERAQAIDTVRKYNPRLSFPTIVVDDGAQVVVGFKEEDLRKALEI